jgi:hypothetical protein
MATIINGKCDMCGKADGVGGHKLLKCTDCGVLVHELCYAKAPSTNSKDPFTCHACKAIGREIEVNIPSKVGGCGEDMGKKREIMIQQTRPVECVLCSVKSGMHAMHPLYDTHGPEGRQLVLPARGVGFKRKEKRLAWVHSLCAQFICSFASTGGCVYGCFDDGAFEGDDEEDSEDEDSGKTVVQKYEIGTVVQKQFDEGLFTGKVIAFLSPYYTVKYEDDDEEDLTTKELEELIGIDGTSPPTKKQRLSHCSSSQEEDNADGLVSTKWFCIAKTKKHSKMIFESRQLKCAICKADDTHSLRIPVQCAAYDKYEFHEFRKAHPKIGDRTTPVCTVAIHVGCANWQDSYARYKGKRLKMCYYYPGQTPNFEEGRYLAPVSNCFCRSHAQQVMDYRGKVAAGEDTLSDDSDTKAEKQAAEIAAKKQKNLHIEESSDEESDVASV